MPTVKTTAKKDCLPFFKKGDKAIITPILLEEDVTLHEDIYGVVNKKARGNARLVAIVSNIPVNPTEKWLEEKGLVKVFDKLVAKKGSYKDHTITIKGKEFPSSILGGKTLSDFFK